MDVRQDNLLGALVLTRRDSESFFIGDDIEIVVLEACGGRARLAIRTPKGHRILRSEIIRRGQQPET